MVVEVTMISIVVTAWVLLPVVHHDHADNDSGRDGGTDAGAPTEEGGAPARCLIWFHAASAADLVSRRVRG